MEIFIFQPGINFLNRFKYPTKIGIINIVLIIFITGLLFIIAGEINKHIVFAERQKVGLEYIDALKNLTEDFQQYRALKIEYFHEKKLWKTKST